jgi:hypothetical protein
MPPPASFARAALIRTGLISTLGRSAIIALGLASLPATVSAQDEASLCLITAERVDAGETLSEAERQEAHEACLAALAATGSVVQKYQFQEADFAITGTRAGD